MKNRVFIIGTLFAALSLSTNAYAQSPEKRPDLTVAGISLGTAKADIPSLILSAEMSPKESSRPKAPNAQALTAIFENAQKQVLALDYSDHPTAPRVTGIRFEMGDNIDLTTRMESQIRSRYGAPAVVYRLGEASNMLVWETVAPEQSRDFGPLVTISLVTGETAKLTLSQFTRPELTLTARSSYSQPTATPSIQAPATGSLRGDVN